MAEIGVHLIGKVERRATDRYIDDLALGREHVDAILEQIDAHALEEVARAVSFDGRQQRAQLVDLAVIGLVASPAFLIAPVRGNAPLGIGVHLVGADLNLDRLVAGSDDRGVDRAIQIVLRGGDVVVELAGNELPERVHDTERRIAFGNRIDEHPRRADIHDLVEGELLRLHLAPDAVDVLRPAVDLVASMPADAQFAAAAGP